MTGPGEEHAHTAAPERLLTRPPEPRGDRSPLPQPATAAGAALPPQPGPPPHTRSPAPPRGPGPGPGQGAGRPRPGARPRLTPPRRRQSPAAGGGAAARTHEPPPAPPSPRARAPPGSVGGEAAARPPARSLARRLQLPACPGARGGVRARTAAPSTPRRRRRRTPRRQRGPSRGARRRLAAEFPPLPEVVPGAAAWRAPPTAPCRPSACSWTPSSRATSCPWSRWPATSWGSTRVRSGAGSGGGAGVGGGRGEPAGPPLRPAARPAPWAVGEGTGSVLSPCSAARPSGPRCKRALSWGEPPYREAGGRLREPVFGLDFRRYDGPQRSLIGVSALRGRVSSRWTKGPDGCRVTARQVSVCPCEFGLSFQTGKKICVLDLVLACARVVRPEDRFKVVVCT